MHISVFCGASLPHSEQITEAARQLGRAIARGGHTLLYGGSNLGLMGATSGAALQEGGRVVGVIPTFFSDDIIHSQPVSELVRVRTLAERTFKKMQTAFSDVSHLQESKGIDGLFGCEVLAKQRLLISYKCQELILID